MLIDVAAKVETSVVKLDTKAELVGVVFSILFAFLFAYLIASSLCSFVQSLRFLNTVALCRKVSAVSVIAKDLN